MVVLTRGGVEVVVVVVVVGGDLTGTLGTLVHQLLTVFSLEVGFVAFLDEAVHEIHQVCNPGGVSGSTQLDSPPGSEDHSADGAALTSDLRLVTYDNVSRYRSLTDRQTAVHHHLALSHSAAAVEEQNTEEDLGNAHGRHHDWSPIT